MIVESKGEKLGDKDLKDIYGGSDCGELCSTFNCTDSGGYKFFKSFDVEMGIWETGFHTSPGT